MYIKLVKSKMALQCSPTRKLIAAREAAKNTDITLLISDGAGMIHRYPAHRLILEANCLFFQNLDRGIETVTLPIVAAPDIVTLILNFVYGLEVSFIDLPINDAVSSIRLCLALGLVETRCLYSGQTPNLTGGTAIEDYIGILTLYLHEEDSSQLDVFRALFELFPEINTTILELVMDHVGGNNLVADVCSVIPQVYAQAAIVAGTLENHSFTRFTLSYLHRFIFSKEWEAANPGHQLIQPDLSRTAVPTMIHHIPGLSDDEYARLSCTIINYNEEERGAIDPNAAQILAALRNPLTVYVDLHGIYAQGPNHTLIFLMRIGLKGMSDRHANRTITFTSYGIKIGPVVPVFFPVNGISAVTGLKIISNAVWL